MLEPLDVDAQRRLRFQVLRAIAELYETLRRTVRPIEIYNHRLLRHSDGRRIDAEILACWNERLLRRDDAGAYELVAKGREFIQAYASNGQAPSVAADDITDFVPPRHRGRKPGSKNKPKDPERLPGPVRDIPASEVSRAAEITQQLLRPIIREDDAPAPVHPPLAHPRAGVEEILTEAVENAQSALDQYLTSVGDPSIYEPLRAARDSAREALKNYREKP